jgi:RNA polymerase sigma-70 factor (ECF subfamily)
MNENGKRQGIEAEFRKSSHLDRSRPGGPDHQRRRVVARLVPDFSAGREAQSLASIRDPAPPAPNWMRTSPRGRRSYSINRLKRKPELWILPPQPCCDRSNAMNFAKHQPNPDRSGEEHSDDTDDLAAMQRLKTGDDLALNDLMTRWQDAVIAFAYRYTGSRDDALDISQETFVRVYVHRHRFTGSGKFSTWLFTIAVNLCHNHARWRGRHPSVPLEPSESDQREQSSTVPLPWENVESNELADAVKREIQELPEQLKAVLLLSVYEERSHSEIGQMLHCSAKAVETRLYRARTLLRAALTRHKLL